MTSEKNMSNAPVKPQIPELNLKFNLFCKTPATKKIITSFPSPLTFLSAPDGQENRLAVLLTV